MAANTSRSARLGETLLLRSGVRVCLRLAHFSDVGAIAELIDRHGASGGPSAERLVQFDPRRRYVVCAMALIDGSERLVGLGEIELALGAAEPEVLIFNPDVGEELPVVLRDVLCAAAEAATRTRAA